MAISQDKWDKARTLFESGKLSLSEIATQTGIDKSSISKKAKIQQWSSVENSDYIDAKVLIYEKKSTLPIEKINTLDDIANNIIRRKNLVYNASEKALVKLTGLIDDIDEAQDMKHIVDAIDKASITLGVNQRHASSAVINNANVQQNNQPTQINIIRDV